MSTRNNLLLLGAAGLLFMALPTLAKTPPKVKSKLVPKETAIIENTGSTNTQGFQIIVYSTGGARVSGKNRGLPLSLNGQLFRDLAAAMPLSSLPVHHGMRSASFGTRTFITYKGQRSPDLSFGGDARATALKADITAILQHLVVVSAPRFPAIPPPAPVSSGNH